MMSANTTFPLEGGCACKYVRYRMEKSPLIVHCCHCYWCQRETGSAFAINALIEASNITTLNASPTLIGTPSESGRGQVITRCPKCCVAIWSNYGSGPIIRFVRVGTLDQPDKLEPNVHIYTNSKLPWVRLPEGATSFEEYYQIEDVWSKESLERRKFYLPEVARWRAERKPSDVML